MLGLAKGALQLLGLRTVAGSADHDRASAGADEDELWEDEQIGFREAAPGIARIAASAAMRTAEWTARSYVRTTSRVVRAAANGESPGEFFQEMRQEVRDQLRELLGVTDIEDRVRSVVGDRVIPIRDSDEVPGDQTANLREAGAELLNRSADVTYEEPAHPAYIRILSELAPDEARILRLLATEGAQPAVDVRTGRPLNVGSELVAPGISMIGEEAGCRYLDRVPSYLNNLYRLGLTWFSREPIKDRLRYQVLEAQPKVLGAMRTAGRGKTIRRSIHLTPFGEDFCRVCLPLETAEIESLPVDPAKARPA